MTIDKDYFMSKLDRICAYISTSREEDFDLLAKSTVWFFDGKLSEDDLECCLESVKTNRPNNEVAYFCASLRNRMQLSSREMNLLIRRTRVPSFLQRRGNGMR